MVRFLHFCILFPGLLLSFGSWAQTNYADSEIGSLNTVPPMFSGLTVYPGTAHQGQSVTITFSASEPLAANPAVEIRNVPATFLKVEGLLHYTYVYDIQREDEFGFATITIRGSDALGNAGALTDENALEILTPGHGLPLHFPPLIVALLVVGACLAARHKHGKAAVILLFSFLFLTSPPLQADSPQVANVRFVQGPDDAGGTKVDIFYDLVAPNGPCTLTVSLSKNGGLDGFNNPVTSVSGDLYGVETGTNHKIVWAIAKDYPNEDIPEARLRVTADESFSLVFLTDTHVDMKCSELSLQTIARWIVDQAETLNIRFVGHMGDVGDERGSGNLAEMLGKARSALQAIVDAGIPLSVCIGNHDYQPSEDTGLRSADAFNRNDTFGREFYSGRTWFGGTFEEEAADPGPYPGGTINNYVRLNVYNRPYLFLALEYYPRDKVLDWADDLIRNRFPDHHVVVLTHAYLSEYGVLSTSSYAQAPPGPEYSNSGSSMWDRYFKYWENLRFVLNGHFINEPRQNYLRQTSMDGHVVHSHFFNYQNWGYRSGSLYYDTSHGLHQAATIRIFTIYPISNRVVVKSYTPSALREIEPAFPDTYTFIDPPPAK